MLDAQAYYWLGLTIIIIVVFLLRRLANSRVGRAWTAIREDEDPPSYGCRRSSSSCGRSPSVPDRRSRGLALREQDRLHHPDNFPFFLSILFLSAVVLGGSGNMAGAILGGRLLVWSRAHP